MKKMYISIDERWPEYELMDRTTIDDYQVQIPDEMMSRYRLAKRDWERIQGELHELYEEARAVAEKENASE